SRANGPISPEYWDAATDLQIDLLAQAMACDVTRFATLRLDDLSFGAAGATGLMLPDNNHQDLAHRYNGPHRDGGDPQSWRELGLLNRYHYGKCARLLQRLDAFGVLDETLILITSDMGDPAAHSSRNVPTLIAGGGGGTIRTGRRLRLTPDCPNSIHPYCNQGSANLTPNNHLLVTIAQAFGIPIDRFGTDSDPAVVQGELSDLLI
ncbi:MAG: hypothetical protein AAFX99_02640, partial [Myxococcota bacterium]